MNVSVSVLKGSVEESSGNVALRNKLFAGIAGIQLVLHLGYVGILMYKYDRVNRSEVMGVGRGDRGTYLDFEN